MSATIAPPNRLAELPIEIFLEIVQDELLLVGADLNLPPVLEAMRPYPRHYEAVSNSLNNSFDLILPAV
jgi:hypothetical protein